MPDYIAETISTYDRAAQSYARSRSKYWFAHGKLKPYIKPAKAILDYGCGPGVLVSEMEDSGFKGEYVGFDHSQGMIKHATELYPDYNFTNDWSTVENRQFDLILSLAVFHHIEPTKLPETLSKLATVATPKANLLASFWQLSKVNKMEENFISSLNAYLVPIKDGTNAIIGRRLYYEYQVEQIIKLVEQSGWKVSKHFNWDQNLICEFELSF